MRDRDRIRCGFRHVPATHSDLIPATDSDRVPATHSDPVPATYSDRDPATLLVEVPVSDHPWRRLLSLRSTTMLSHPTLETLHALGLHGCAKGFKEMEASPAAASLTHAEWLALILDHEVTYRGQKRFEARAGRAKLALRLASRKAPVASSRTKPWSTGVSAKTKLSRSFKTGNLAQRMR
ncbi:hypothetical protein MTBSS4_250034 [Magnetospirillum sp. SS-4]|nr:hypothetical protein MTBSS4_250034 [Magnetospirillum sp. SS-4]